ncbi:DoxX family membrane protein [Flavobacterium branchiarum]|uniref:DoxX family membrane protein n=1 Tax=Flavobacterium branchiarum TaxID=1114870 RepID=A0ABV5FQH9_9FLAO|nr:DoxX family membrane protein [Flavobacterium branchiarum]MDN3673147.1 DoxX family membrane protein [Flavobacterium branchiarum]
MKNTQQLAQLFLRLALGIGFILPVLDRLGMLGAAGEPNVGWGNWTNFVDYTNSLIPYLNHNMANIMGVIATAAEIIFGVLLIIGFKIKITAYGSFLLTLSFALSMLLFAGYRAPFNYSVFTASAASLLLATIPFYNWSIDKLLASKN